MPLDRFVLILVAVIAAAGVTLWLGALVATALNFPFGLSFLVPVALIAYVLWRVIAERISNKEDDHYDRIEK
jgi:membrane protein implicated in regulation of membrane protease activity